MRTLAILFALFAFTAQAQEIRAPFKAVKLKNGLTAIIHADKDAAKVAVNVWYHVGSGHERPGRTGFAHLFEHLMFEGSEHVPEGAFDVWLEAAGGSNNGSTTEDRTNYYEDMPPTALELALYLEADRMGFLLGRVDKKVVDSQRDVVKNELRQSYLNRPYGKVWLELPALLYPKEHPYSWPVIGSMDDLSAAAYDDVVEFFKRYYAPGNAVIVIAGNVDLNEAERLVRKWFSDIPAGQPPAARERAAPVMLKANVQKTLTDDVQLEKLMLVWPTVPLYSKDDAALDVLAQILGEGKVARLQKRLVHELKRAQSVEVWHQSQLHSGQFAIEVVATQDVKAKDLAVIVDQELKKIIASGPSKREVERAQNQTETHFYDAFERIGRRADNMNNYVFHQKPADWFREDLKRYQKLTAAEVQAAARAYLERPRVELIVLPKVTK